MRDEYNELDKVVSLSVDNSSLNQANILQELKSHQEQMVERMEQSLKINLMETLTGLCRQLKNKATVNNLAQPNLSNNAMFKLLTSLQNKIEELAEKTKQDFQH